jgi:hypothetical protein
MCKRGWRREKEGREEGRGWKEVCSGSLHTLSLSTSLDTSLPCPLPVVRNMPTHTAYCVHTPCTLRIAYIHTPRINPDICLCALACCALLCLWCIVGGLRNEAASSLRDQSVCVRACVIVRVYVCAFVYMCVCLCAHVLLCVCV